MNENYEKIWESARPYYEKGRPMDVDHIEWMMKDAMLVCDNEGIDDSILLPLVILHDVGYGEIPPGNPFNLDLRKEHMKKGGEIAEKILKKLNYDSEKIDQISNLVSVHDDWALGDDQSYKDNIFLGVFNDLDFTWMATPKGFPALMKILNKSAEEMIKYLETDEKLIKRPFSTKTTKQLFESYLKDRRSELASIKDRP